MFSINLDAYFRVGNTDNNLAAFSMGFGRLRCAEAAVVVLTAATVGAGQDLFLRGPAETCPYPPCCLRSGPTLPFKPSYPTGIKPAPASMQITVQKSRASKNKCKPLWLFVLSRVEHCMSCTERHFPALCSCRRRQ